MKMNRRICAVLCALFMAFTAYAPIASAQQQTPENAADILYKLNLFKGTDNGFELEKSLTRAEAITMIVRLLGDENNLSKTVYKHPFDDVPDWADKYIGYAYTNNITKGISDTEFGANDEVNIKQFLTFILRTLEYRDPDDFLWNFPEDLAMQVGILDPDYTGTCLRGDMVVICEKALNTNYKNSSLPLYKMLVEKGVFTMTEYKDVYGLNATRFSSGGGRSTSSSAETNNNVTAAKITLKGETAVNSNAQNRFLLKGILSEDAKAVSLTLSLDGKVDLSGFDMMLKYNKEHFRLVELDDAFDLQIYSGSDENNGIISFNYVGIKNINQPKNILTAQFELISNNAEDGVFELTPIEIIKISDKDKLDIEDAEYTLTDVKYSIK